jgi:glycosyltransferase involved in cell wall biosynthesis
MSKRRRVLFLSPFYQNTSGVGTVATGLAGELSARGNLVDKLEYQPWRDKNKYKFETRGREYTFNTADELVRFLEQNKLDYDVMHFHNQVFADGKNEGLFKLYRHVPKLTQIHCVVPYDQKVLGERSHHNYDEMQRQVRMLGKSDKVIHLTPEVQDIAKKLYGDEHPENSGVIGNFALPPYVDKSKVASLRRKLSHGDQTIFLYAGRLSEEKGILELADAFKKAKEKHPKIKLVICGEAAKDSTIKSELEEKLKGLVEGKDFQFMGRVSQAELSNFYAASDYFIQPSRYEHFSVSAIEAMSHKKPVITTKMPSIEKTFKLDDERERLAIPINGINSPDSIEAAIDQAMTADPKQLSAMTQRAHKFYSSELTPGKIAAKFEKEYDALVGRKVSNEASHAYVVPFKEGENINSTVGSIIKRIKDGERVILASYAGAKLPEDLREKFAKELESGRLAFLPSSGGITKTKSSAINKGISLSTQVGVDYVSIVLPGYQVTGRHDEQIESFDKNTAIVHGGPQVKGLEGVLKRENPLHQSTVTIKTGSLGKTGMFYDSMGYAEDMDFYQKTLKHHGKAAIKGSGVEVIAK